MNPKQIDRVEGALMGALSYLQSHPAPQSGMGSGIAQHGDEYGQVVSELRVAVALLRTWKALARGLGHEDSTVVELPGQLHIPGVDPCDPKDE